MAKKPTIEVSTYSKPANLPGFLVELMCPRWLVLSLRCSWHEPLKSSARAGHALLFVGMCEAYTEEPENHQQDWQETQENKYTRPA